MTGEDGDDLRALAGLSGRDTGELRDVMEGAPADCGRRSAVWWTSRARPVRIRWRGACVEQLAAWGVTACSFVDRP
ncbi:hypothetical protein F4560_000245 [Saccharothrix ecbatanensis]|uniref:Uncharacterized protein n=1 Tax=Saccharothrix ecbatanensis TaxID=1105145 RepID=A0A7W9HDX5_9PSEU|nr:hypothetical protein [Saccharothrix ecbatanensis]MBB5800477.1 hypothetical protein [Saccharothrix ecbatanensis]